MQYSNDTVAIIDTLYAAYHKQDKQGKDVYVAMLEDIPSELLRKTVKKIILEQTFLPSIAEIRAAAMSLLATVDPSRKVKTWQEAQQEILAGIGRTWYCGCLGEIPMDHPDFGKPCEPMWSTPEIKAAVDAYGFKNFQTVDAENMPTVWAQLRRLYEQACQSKAEDQTNRYVIGQDVDKLQQAVGQVVLALPELRSDKKNE